MSTGENVMRRKEALKIALTCIEEVYNRVLFLSDSKVAEQQRVRLAQAMAKIESMKAQKEMKL